jgi:3-hydroxyisobutyrate dehydrogenase
MTTQVTFVGLGVMGLPMARNLAASGVVDLVVHDTDPRRTALLTGPNVRAGSPADTVTASQVLLLMLPDSDVVERLLVHQDLLRRMRPGAVVLDMSSSRPASTVRLAEQAAGHGVGYVDAPVSGGRTKAETGQLSIMVGGAPDHVSKVRPLLQTMGTSIHPTGPAGSGHALKALNNLLSAIGIAGAAEVLTAGTKFGLDPQVMLDVINASTGRNQATEVKYGPYVLSGRFDSGFALHLMVKDLTTARRLVEDTGTAGPLTATVLDVAEQTLAATAEPMADHTELARWIAARSGVDLHEATRAHHTNDSEQDRRPTMTDNGATDNATNGTLDADAAQAYIDDMARKRGYVLDYHKIMAKQDFPVLKATNGLVGAAYLDQRRLDRKTKELIFIVSLTVMRASKGHIQSHIRVALDLGVSPEEILEAIEISLPEAGIVAFQTGFDAWREVVGADGIEPTVTVHAGGSGGNG